MYRRLSIFTTFFTLALSVSVHSAVTHWRVVKGAYYLQHSDNAPAASTTNWGVFAEVETDLPGDATSVVMEGGNIAGSIAFELEDTEWELGQDFTNKAALDAVFPADATYSIILSGGTLGTVTQQFAIGSDAYPEVPFLTEADYTDCLALEALEPFELNWNHAGTTTTISLEIYTGGELDEGETLFEIYSNNFNSVALPWNLFEAGSNYNGYIDFANASLQSGTGGFGIWGDVSFNTSLGFYINAVNTANGYDDFNDDSADTNKWALTFPPEEAVDVFDEDLEQLNYLSAGTGDTFVAWSWVESELSYTQDWAVAVNVGQLHDGDGFTGDEEVYLGLLVAADGNVDNNFSAEFINSSYGLEVATFGSLNGDEVVTNAYALVETNTVSMKISFDAATKMLYTAYSIGEDFIIQTNYSAKNWGMTDTSVFNPVLFCGNEGVESTNGQVFADNFRIYDGLVLSNEVDLIDLEFLHSYGDGSILLEGNWVKTAADTSHRVQSMEVTTSGGDAFSVPFDGEDGGTIFWDIDIEFDFSELWNPANDGDWTITFGLNNGTFQSTIVPFTQDDGVTPMPNFYASPLFLPPSPVNNSLVESGTVNFAWSPAASNANLLTVDEVTEDNETGSIDLLYGDSIPGVDLDFVDATVDGPLSTTNAGPYLLGYGFRRMRLNEGYARAAYNGDGIPYIVSKISEADIIFTVKGDADGDGMEDTWEIQFFGSTNAFNGGASENWDADRFTNLEEYILGSNPTDPLSGFGVQTEPLAAVGGPSGPLPEYRIDLGDQAAAVGGNWNEVGYLALNAGPVTLKEFNSGSAAAGVTLRTLTQALPYQNPSSWNGGTDIDWVDASAAKDLLFASGALILGVEGLDPSKTYRVELVDAYDSVSTTKQTHFIIDTVLGNPGSGNGWSPTSTRAGSPEGTAAAPNSFERYQHGWVDKNWLIWENAVPGRHGFEGQGFGADAFVFYSEDDFVNSAGSINAIRIIEMEEPPPPGFAVSWNALPGRTYDIRWVDELGGSSLLLTNGLVHPQNSYTDTVYAAESTGFYSIDVNLTN